MILIFGGAFLAYEGAHKVHERLTGHPPRPRRTSRPSGEFTPEHEKRTIAQAIRTDFILQRRDHGDRAQGGRQLRPRREHLDARDRAGGRRGR